MANENSHQLILSDWHNNALQFMQHVKGLSIAEIGCGCGDLAIHLSKLGASVMAVDFSPKAIEAAKIKAQAHSASVEFIVGNAMELPLPDHTFDLVVSCECLEHVPDPQQSLRECARILKPG